jgi:hypothetical protein
VLGNAELRLSLGRYYLVLPGEYGVFALVDTGRVWLEGEDSDRWHTGFGGGLWFAYEARPHRHVAAVARSDENTSFYLGHGVRLLNRFRRRSRRRPRPGRWCRRR